MGDMRQRSDAAEKERGRKGGSGGWIAVLADDHAVADLEGHANDGRHEEVRIDRRN